MDNELGELGLAGYLGRMSGREPDESGERGGKVSPFSDEQVIHDTRQVRSPEGLVVGRDYKEHNTKSPGSGITIRITDVDIDCDRFGYMYVGGDANGVRVNGSLADHGIVPYRQGSENECWNTLNYLVPVESDGDESV
jgi:hypothetical protein